MNDDYAALSRYESFKNEVNKMISDLNNAINQMDSIKESFASYFIINDNRADNNKLTEFYNSLVSHRDFLQNTCIPSIDSKIAKIKAAIEERERKEREEKERALSQSV